jgi:4-amino-4-deoxy-L-arabinose transferase-like glycosyltransferase
VKRSYGLALAAITLLGLGLRLWGLDWPSFKIWDDFFALRLAVLDYRGILQALAHQPFDAYQEYQPPLYYFLVHACLGVAKTDALARLTGVAAGTLTIPALCCLGRRLLGRPTGLVAALLLAVSVFHIEYSQQIRNYVPFLLLATLSMNFFAAWLFERQRRALAWYALSTAVMLYTSYMSTAFLASQAVLWLGFMASGPRRGLAKRLAGQSPFLAAAALVVLAYLPWVPRLWEMYRVLAKITGNVNPPMWETLSIAFREFTSYYCEIMGYPEVVIPVLLLALAGAGLALRRRTKEAAVLMVWVLVTLIVVIGFNRHGLHVRSRHLIALLPGLLLFAAHPLALWAGRFRRPWAGATAVLAAVVMLNAFNLRVLPFFYRREDDRLKDLCYTLASFRRDTDRLFFWGSDSKWFPAVSDFVTGWYLPGVFKAPGQDFTRAYLRTWVLSAPAFHDELAGQDNVLIQGRRGYVDYSLAGVVNTAPVVLDFGADGTFAFHEAFASPSAYGLVYGLDNLTLDRGQAVLRDPGRPGSLTYAFTLAHGASLSRMRLGIEAEFLTDISGVPDSSLVVSAAGPQGDFSPVYRFVLAEAVAKSGFNGRRLDLSREIELPGSLCADGLRVRVELDPGQDHGAVSVKALTFTAQGRSAGRPAKSPARLRLEHALANSLMALAGEPVPLGKPLYAFTTRLSDPFEPGRVRGAADLAAFRQAHPGLKPVLTLADADAEYLFFDPALSRPGLPVPGSYRVAGQARSLTAWGLSGAAVIGLDGTPVPLATAGAEPAFVNLAGTGAGRIILRPLFVPGGPAASGAFESQGLKQSPAEDFLTCQEAKPCHVTYKLSAPGGFKDLIVRAYPRVFADTWLKNFCRISVSTDGQAFETLDTFRSNASGHWDGWRVPRTVVKNWASPVNDVYVRFDLSGDGAQLWSSAEFPMLAQADFAAAPPGFPTNVFSLDAAGPGGAVQALDAWPGDFKQLLR